MALTRWWSELVMFALISSADSVIFWHNFAFRYFRYVSTEGI